MQRWSLLIDGRKVATNGFEDVINPSTGDVIGAMPLATARDLDHAVEAASRAFAVWKDVPDADRAEACRAIAMTLEAHAEEPRKTPDAGAGQAAQRARFAVRNRRCGGLDPSYERAFSSRRNPAGQSRRPCRAAPQADRRRRLHHAVELAGDDRLLAHHPGDPDGQHRRHQAVAVDAALHHPARRVSSTTSSRPVSSMSSPVRPRSAA
ncbi:hypothetical protein ACQ3JU_0625 (plasmid) [Bradyrhizobium guangxiense]